MKIEDIILTTIYGANGIFAMAMSISNIINQNFIFAYVCSLFGAYCLIKTIIYFIKGLKK